MLVQRCTNLATHVLLTKMFINIQHSINRFKGLGLTYEVTCQQRTVVIILNQLLKLVQRYSNLATHVPRNKNVQFINIHHSMKIF